MQELHVKIGEVKVGRDDNILKATLGSCVGIGLFWRKKNIYGLAHCLLPDNPHNHGTPSGKYVTQAIPFLFKLLQIPKDQHSEIEAIIVGGGNMTSAKVSGNDQYIGTLNANKAQKILQENKITIIHKETGGEIGRQVIIECAKGTFEVKNIPRLI